MSSIESKINTIKELSISKTCEDLWDEFDSTSNNPNNNILRFSDNRTDLRLVGPFVNASRFYSPFLKYKDLDRFRENVDMEGMANKDTVAIKRAKEYLSKNFKDGIEDYSISGNDYWKYNAPKPIKCSIDQYFDKLEKGMTWQKCIMSNCLLRNYNYGSCIKVIVITRNIYEEIINNSRNFKGNISGLFAGDISITKTKVNNSKYDNNSKYNIKIQNAGNLKDEEISYIINKGLIDIRTLIKEINNYKNSSYYYKLNSNYRLGSEFMREFLSDASGIIEKEHFENVDDNLHNVPREAFENIKDINNAIIGLDL